jgi:hypothetical protein
LAEILRRDPAQRASVVGEVAGGGGLDPGPMLSVEEGENEPGPLAGHAESLPAGREYLEPGARAEQGVCQPGTPFDEVLAVVQQQERLS